jgi:hypothetical protein
MTATYWKMVAENIPKGLGPRTIGKLGTSGRFLARTGGVIGVGFMAYELFKSYKDNIENEPAYKEMVILQLELEKWGSAVSSLGRKPFEGEEYGDLDEGGAINALHKKVLMEAEKVKPADPQEADKLIERAISYIKETENVLEDNDFNEKISDLSDRLEVLRRKISAEENYRAIQEELSEIVAELKPIESAYSSRIYDCSREIQKKAGSNAAWAALSMVTLGLVKKPKG